MYNIACCHSLLGNTDDALDWLQRSIEAGFLDQGELLRSDSDLDSIRSNPRFKRLTGIAPPDGLTRDAAWQFDIDYFVKRCKELHYDLYRVVSEEEFAKAVADLGRDIPKLEDHQIIVRLQRVLAMTGDGHSRIRFPTEGEGAFHGYPIRFQLLTDGLYVVGADEELRDTIGSRVVRFGNVSSRMALAAVKPYLSLDSPMWEKVMGPHFLTIAEVVDTAGIADDYNRVPIELEKADGTTYTVYLVAGAFHRHDLIDIKEIAAGPTPLWRKDRRSPFWFEHLPERNLVFFQYNAVQDAGDERIAEFAGRLFAFIETNKIKHLIIDMRHNGGGDNFLNQPIVHGLIKCDRINRRGHLFVVIGRHTFSAAMNGVIDIERNTHAIFVGEPTGSSPNFVGEGKYQRMPNSGVLFNASPVYWQSSTATDKRIWLPPDIAADLTIEHLRTNRDPALEAIYVYIDGEAKREDSGEPD